MNYKPVAAGNQTNGNVGTKESIYVGQARKKIVPTHEYILLPLWTPDSPISSSPKRSNDEVVDDAGQKSTKDPANKGNKDDQDLRDEFEREFESSPINTARTKDADDEPMMPNTGIFGDAYDDEDFVAGGDMNNLESSMVVSPIATTRVHKDHLVEKIIGDLHSPPQIRRMTKNSKEHGLDELLQFKLQKVWTLIDLPYGKRAIRTKWVYRNKKDKRDIVMDVKSAFLYGKIKVEVYVCQPLGFEDPEFTDRVYKVEKALYGLHQAPKAWYETLSTYLLENGFQRGTIDKTLFIKKFKGDILLVQIYVDDIIFGSTKKELCTEFEKLMHKNQDKYVDEILKKFGFSTMKTASTPMEISKPLMKDDNDKDVDVHLYRSMIRSLMYLTSSRPDICSLYLKGQPKLGLWYPKDSQFYLEAYTDSDYASASLGRKSTTRGCQFLGSRLISWQCKKQTVVANSTTEAEYITASNCYGQIYSQRHLILMIGMGWKYYLDEIRVYIGNSRVSAAGQKVSAARQKVNAVGQTKNNVTEIPQYSEPTNLDADAVVHEERGDSVERAATTTASLDAEQDSGNINRTQSTAIPNVPFPQGIRSGGSPRCQEAMGDTIAQNRSERVSTPSYDSPLLGVNTPVSDKERIELKELIDMYIKLSDRVLDLENVKDAQALEIKKLKKRVKKLERKNKSRITQPKRRVYKPRVKSSEESLGEKDASKQGRNSDKNKELNVAEDEHMFDLSDLYDTEVIVDQEETIELVEDKGSAEKGVSAAEDKSSASRPQKLKGVLFKEPKWDSIKARIDVDAQLAKRIKVEEREQMPVEEQARLLMEFIAARKKFFAAKRVEEQRNKPPTKAEQRKKMCTYMKHMAGYTDMKFKGKSFDVIKQMFDKAYKQVNDFVPMDSESSRKKVDSSADGSTKNYKIFSAMLNDFNRQDVLDLYRLVKERFETTSPEEYDRLL
ncbi:putative ribonuclease H-like domain-containing protein [Tanacetum coccineum]